MPEETMRTIFARNLKYYLDQAGKTQTDLCKYLNVSSATTSDWCNARKMPRADKIQSIANWLGISIGSLMESNSDSSNSSDLTYYFDEETREIVQFMYENPEYKILFDASKKVKKEDIMFVKEMIDRIRGNTDDAGY